MARHRLSLEEQLKGVRAALRNSNTPAQFRQGLQDRLADLERQLQRQSKDSSVLKAGGQAVARYNRVFISFAIEDKWAKEYLVGQARNEKSPFSFTDMSIKEPFDEKWKTRCRTVIKGCDGMIALLSTNTRNADGARWEMRCASEEGVPVIGVHTDSQKKGAIPPELSGMKIIEWSWDGIAKFLNTL